MIGPFEIMYAFFLDLAIGDPAWLPHPVRIIGKTISGVERFLRRIFTTATGERWGGVLLVLSVTLPSYFVTDRIVMLLYQASGSVWTILGTAVIVYLTATTIATRELIRSAERVITSIRNNDILSARQGVSMIVGRDTLELSDKGVLKATIETLAENLSDGIIAPLFYLAIGGLPLAIAYKAVNTLDSMVGYKNEKYRHFGWAAARLDDLANYLPARITGLMIILSVFFVEQAKAIRSSGSKRANPAPSRLDPVPTGERKGGIPSSPGERARVRGDVPISETINTLSAARSWNIMLRDGRKHPSPNSGLSEAAMAGALGIRLGGPSAYGGVVSNKPYIGEEERQDYLSASHEAMAIVKVSSVLAASIAICVAAVRSIQ